MRSFDYSWVVRGKQRRAVLSVMDKDKIPSQISRETKIALNNTSDVLRLFVKRNLVVCVNEKEKTGRLYRLTEKGKKIREKIID
ncbi:transcriptional regulator [Candidatus Woesearchaeota archaeon]|nr:transcriptional regulator [Candidatus Woesearchaeota archaeon]